MANDSALREQLGRLLSWEDAHASFDAIVAGIPPHLQGSQPAGLPYSPWQLLEHLRITQRDILDFCRDPEYQEREWPREYWPPAPAPPSETAWDESVETFRRDRDALCDLASDSTIELDGRVPHGTGQTYLRELLLAADHASYHLGELVVVRRLLGIWPESGGKG